MTYKVSSKSSKSIKQDRLLASLLAGICSGLWANWWKTCHNSINSSQTRTKLTPSVPFTRSVISFTAVHNTSCCYAWGTRKRTVRSAHTLAASNTAGYHIRGKLTRILDNDISFSVIEELINAASGLRQGSIYLDIYQLGLLRSMSFSILCDNLQYIFFSGFKILAIPSPSSHRKSQRILVSGQWLACIEHTHVVRSP
jgi:hypothetical protein